MLTEKGCNVTVFPYNTKADEILEGSFDGVVVTNGPGNPAENTEVISEIKELMANNDGILPEWLDGLVKIAEKNTIRVAKSKK